MKPILLIFGLAFSLQAQTVTASWEAPTINEDGSPINGDLAGYTIYYGTVAGSYSSNIDVGDITTYSIVAGLTWGVKYYIAVTAYDFAGNESGYSEEVSIILPPFISPGVPTITSVSRNNKDKSIFVRWGKVVGAVGYVTAITETSVNYGVEVTRLISGYPDGWADDPNIIWDGLQYDVTYYLAVASIDMNGDKGMYSEEKFAILKEEDTTPPKAPTNIQINWQDGTVTLSN